MNKELTKQRAQCLVIPMHGAVTPDQMDAMADQLEETVRSLRAAANVLRGGGVMKPLSASYPPAVLETAEKILRQANRPLHIVDLFERIRAAGAVVKDHYNLSSMLSKDGKKTFSPAYGQRGYWELVR